MKKLKMFEIDAIVDCVVNQIINERKSKVEWKKEYDEMNELVRRKGEEINELIKEFVDYKREMYDKYKSGDGYNSTILFNMNGIGSYNLNYDFISLNGNSGVYFKYEDKLKIKNEIIMSNLRDEEVDGLVNRLVEKFK